SEESTEGRTTKRSSEINLEDESEVTPASMSFEQVRRFENENVNNGGNEFVTEEAEPRKDNPFKNAETRTAEEPLDLATTAAKHQDSISEVELSTSLVFDPPGQNEHNLAQNHDKNPGNDVKQESLIDLSKILKPETADEEAYAKKIRDYAAQIMYWPTVLFSPTDLGKALSKKGERHRKAATALLIHQQLLKCDNYFIGKRGNSMLGTKHSGYLKMCEADNDPQNNEMAKLEFIVKLSNVQCDYRKYIDSFKPHPKAFGQSIMITPDWVLTDETLQILESTAFYREHVTITPERWEYNSGRKHVQSHLTDTVEDIMNKYKPKTSKARQALNKAELLRKRPVKLKQSVQGDTLSASTALTELSVNTVKRSRRETLKKSSRMVCPKKDLCSIRHEELDALQVGCSHTPLRRQQGQHVDHTFCRIHQPQIHIDSPLVYTTQRNDDNNSEDEEQEQDNNEHWTSQQLKDYLKMYFKLETEVDYREICNVFRNTFNDRKNGTYGIVVIFFNCGIITGFDESTATESVRRIIHTLLTFIKITGLAIPNAIIYDNACSVRLWMNNWYGSQHFKQTEYSKFLFESHLVIDRFHQLNHKRQMCKSVMKADHETHNGIFKGIK
ncbi:unnamed protein product, partial [Didymodactylos carnosus]